ncbi:hypothetical protein A9Q83_09725 [Alphaproteobacteria bacterium 46_93_T64]|nr:hypothetical protein A9Q83_09725 [Alphaproteobacteria bacterium 46_93_T64]
MTKAQPEFGIFAAKLNAELVGYASYYSIPFTYSLQPTFVLQQLYVSQSHRSNKIGKFLFNELKLQARDAGAGKLEWRVMPSNTLAKRFYRCLGGLEEDTWEHWTITL